MIVNMESFAELRKPVVKASAKLDIQLDDDESETGTDADAS
jgi:hypothetical protein